MHLFRRSDAHFRVVTVGFLGASGDAVSQLPPTGRYRLTFKRGLKATNRGATDWAEVRNGGLAWNHRVALNCTLFERKGAFARKELKFQLERASSALISFRPKVHTVAKGRLDLAECFRRQRTQAQVLLPLEGGQYVVVSLSLGFREWHEGDGPRDEQTDGGLTASDCSDASDAESETAAATSLASLASLSLGAPDPPPPPPPPSHPQLQPSPPAGPERPPPADACPAQPARLPGRSLARPVPEPSPAPKGSAATGADPPDAPAVRPPASRERTTAQQQFPRVEPGRSTGAQSAVDDDLPSTCSWSRASELVPSIGSFDTAATHCNLPQPVNWPESHHEQPVTYGESMSQRDWSPGSARSFASKLREDGWTCPTCLYHNLSHTTHACAVCLAPRAPGGRGRAHPEPDRRRRLPGRGASSSRASSCSSAASSSQSRGSIASFLSRGSHRSSCRRSCCACSGQYKGGDYVPPAPPHRQPHRPKPQPLPRASDDGSLDGHPPHPTPAQTNCSRRSNADAVWWPPAAPTGGLASLAPPPHRPPHRESDDAAADDRRRHAGRRERAQAAADWVRECQQRYLNAGRHVGEESLWAALQEAQPPSSPELSDDSSSESAGTSRRRATVVALAAFEEDDDAPSSRPRRASAAGPRGLSEKHPQVHPSYLWPSTAIDHRRSHGADPLSTHGAGDLKRSCLGRAERPVTDPSGYVDLPPGEPRRKR